jgi:pyruvate dehydrogenase E2 component (dihydrolipoamide acetyltransferase)
MADVVRMPKMSDTMTEGVIVAWHKKVGDKVKTGELLAEIETDKAVMEFESFQEGVLLYIGAEQGKSVKVDDVIAVLGKQGEDYKAALDHSSSAEAKKEAPKKEEPKKEEKKETQPAKDQITEKEVIPQPEGKPKEPEKQQEPATESTRIKASPLAKKIASDSGIELNKIKGSGDEGRIVRRDVEQFLSGAPGGKQESQPALVNGEESYEEVPLSMMRKTIARRLAESKYSAPHFYLTMQINMDRAAEARSALNESNPDQKISFNDIIIKASALALKKNLKVNSSWLGDKIRYNHHVHIGMAVAVEEGLLVPVIRFADQKSLSQIGAEAKNLSGRAREKKLQPEEMQGNTFTISNLGMMDIDEFTAIINPPDACILAVGKIKKIPAVVNGEIKVVNMLTVTMSCDHRVVDGATGAKFLQTLKAYLENPLGMLY